MSWRSLSGSTLVRRSFVSLALSLCALVPHGDAFAQSRDAAGSKDHPLIKRFEGTTILGYEFSKFNDLVLLLGPVKGEARIAVSEYENGRWATPLTATNSQRVEGELTRICTSPPSSAPPSRSCGTTSESS